MKGNAEYIHLGENCFSKGIVFLNRVMFSQV